MNNKCKANRRWIVIGHLNVALHFFDVIRHSQVYLEALIHVVKIGKKAECLHTLYRQSHRACIGVCIGFGEGSPIGECGGGLSLIMLTANATAAATANQLTATALQIS
jgi:hypothetical protein